MKIKKRALAIILIVLCGCVLTALADGVWNLPYFPKSCVKLALFVGVPVCYMVLSRDERMKTFLKPKKRRLLPAFLVGICVYGVIVGGYFLFRNIVDFSGVTKSLAEGEGVTKDNFLYVALYISLVNSLCEELFFRGFAFGALSGECKRLFSYLFSALAFALYHVTILTDWFSPLIFVLLIAGLFLVGLLFDRFDDGADSIYPSWIVHLFANLGINTVGCILFGMIA